MNDLFGAVLVLLGAYALLKFLDFINAKEGNK